LLREKNVADETKYQRDHEYRQSHAAIRDRCPGNFQPGFVPFRQPLCAPQKVFLEENEVITASQDT
jgi:hypothetical protein